MRWFVPAIALQFGVVSMGAGLRGTGNFVPGIPRSAFKILEDKDGDGKPDYKIMTEAELVPVYYGVRFTFEIVAGKGVQFSMTITGRNRRCARVVEEQLLRIAQESLNNALRHGRPQQVAIELDYQPDSVFMRVSDDGCGFDPSDEWSTEGGHWGVISMRERAATMAAATSSMKV